MGHANAHAPTQTQALHTDKIKISHFNKLNNVYHQLYIQLVKHFHCIKSSNLQ